MTEAEKRLWQHLRHEPFKQHHFRRQATIGPYFCDFASHRCRFVVEVDGGQHAENMQDQMRTAALEAEGYRVLRFWNNEVLENIEGVLTAILETLAREKSPPPPTPPRHALRARGEGGEVLLSPGETSHSSPARATNKNA